MKTLSLSALCLWVLCFVGCGPPNVQRYFVPDGSAGFYPPAESVHVLELGMQEIEPTRERLYPDAVALGRSHYTGPEDSRQAVERFAKQIGADLVLWHKQWMETQTSMSYRSRPDRRVTTIENQRADGSKTQRTITTESDVLEPRYHSTDIFIHELLFLRR